MTTTKRLLPVLKLQPCSNLQPSQEQPASSTPTTSSTTGQSTATGLPSSSRLSELRWESCSWRNFAKKIAAETFMRRIVELYTSNVNGLQGKKLGPVKIAQIYETVFLSYPLGHEEKTEKSWERLPSCNWWTSEGATQTGERAKTKEERLILTLLLTVTIVHTNLTMYICNSIYYNFTKWLPTPLAAN